MAAALNGRHYTVMAYGVMAAALSDHHHIVMTYGVMAYGVMTYVVVAYIVTAYIVMTWVSLDWPSRIAVMRCRCRGTMSHIWAIWRKDFLSRGPLTRDI